MNDQHSLESHGMLSFDLVVVNLYPFEQTVARRGCGGRRGDGTDRYWWSEPDSCRGQEPRFCDRLTEPSQYRLLLEELAEHAGTRVPMRRRLAADAFQRTADYDRTIADYFARDAESTFPGRYSRTWRRVCQLRYGENPHQDAALYADVPTQSHSLLAAVQRNGKELSYNNYLDLDAALRIVRSFVQPAVTVVKHTNPCGLAVDETLALAAERAFAGDPVSAFGSMLGINRAVDRETAAVLIRPEQFVEAIIAPSFTPEAIELLTTRPKWKANVRLMELADFDRTDGGLALREVDGGLLLQERDDQPPEVGAFQVVSPPEPDATTWQQLEWAWTAVRHVRSNAIIVWRDGMLCGVGAGQMSRVDSVGIALDKAGSLARGAVLASDAFFPFPDSIDRAHEAGITGVIQPGGSRNDDAVIAACRQHGIALIFTDRRHFWH